MSTYHVLKKYGEKMYIHNRYDKVQKIALILFIEALLIAMGDTRKVVRFHPTELIIPTFQTKLMDGVVELDDETLLNIEFQTGDLTEEFLLRCAQYAVNLRVVSGKHVETKIISTGTRVSSEEIAKISEKFQFEPEIFFYSEFDGLEKLINIKNKIKNNEKLTEIDHYNLIFIPLMGNVNKIEAAFEVFKIVNDDKLFTKKEQSDIKRGQYVIANIIAGDDRKLYEKFMRVIKMLTMFVSYMEEHEDEILDELKEYYMEEGKKEGMKKGMKKGEKKGIDETSVKIAENLKEVLSDEEISKRTGIPIEEVHNL